VFQNPGFRSKFLPLCSGSRYVGLDMCLAFAYGNLRGEELGVTGLSEVKKGGESFSSKVKPAILEHTCIDINALRYECIRHRQ
jgi:hypothetical protein